MADFTKVFYDANGKGNGIFVSQKDLRLAGATCMMYSTRIQLKSIVGGERIWAGGVT